MCLLNCDTTYFGLTFQMHKDSTSYLYALIILHDCYASQFFLRKKNWGRKKIPWAHGTKQKNHQSQHGSLWMSLLHSWDNTSGLWVSPCHSLHHFLAKDSPPSTTFSQYKEPPQACWGYKTECQFVTWNYVQDVDGYKQFEQEGFSYNKYV